MPVITLEVLADPRSNETADIITNESKIEEIKTEQQFIDQNEQKLQDEESKGRSELLEYVMRYDGSVVCKLCGEILQSRSHWYKHKYKVHVIQTLNPAPLFQCEMCLVYFKSRKGYIGHLASRHSELLSDSSPVLTNSQAEASEKTVTTESKNTDPELVIPKTMLPNTKCTITSNKNLNKHNNYNEKKPSKTCAKADKLEPDSEEKRTREEKLVAEIIDRVRRECEAQGTGGPARRGYSRRTTVMHT